MTGDSSLITQSSSPPAESWRSLILREFTPQVARLTLVADPDGLLLEEGVLEGIRKRGFELIPFDDPVAFRFAYESRFRSRWDRGEQTDLVVVLRSAAQDLEALPFDLLQAGRKLSFNLGDLFPNLSYPVVAALDRADLDPLFDAQEKDPPGPLGENATKDFVLRHVFEIAPELIKEPHDLLRVLLRRHYRGRQIPAILDERFVQVLRQKGRFDDWPLETIVPDREAFFGFLQERWPAFLDSLIEGELRSELREEKAGYRLEFAGPALLPFNHDDVRVYIDNLFLEGFLEPVSHEHANRLANTWVASGVKFSPGADKRRRIERLLDSVGKTLPSKSARYQDWLRLAYRWAELIALGLAPNGAAPEQYRQRLETLKSQLDSAFRDWLLNRFASLINLPPTHPVMLHHVPRFLARALNRGNRTKVALLMLDGLSLDQWVVLRRTLTEQDTALWFRENAVFAWIPTLTSVSRQAAFAGRPPLYFPMSIHTTNKEPSHWAQFWSNQGLRQQEVAYAKGLGDGKVDQVSELLSQPRLRVVGLVIDTVDRIMHGMQLGTAGMHNQVRQWCSQGFLSSLLNLLHEKGFQVYITSDHGNIEATGIGQPKEGAVADQHGHRARIYTNQLLRAQVRRHFPDAVEWPPIGLPDDYLALIAPGRAAFSRTGESLVSHGGISVEEVIVPFVSVERRPG